MTTDDRPRYELTDRFVKRNCYDGFEKSLLAISSAATGGKVPAASVLGAKGAGTSSFFRYFVYKHCAQRLVVYVPNAGDDEDAIYSLLMEGLVFGLQCLNTKKAKLLLSEVRMQQPSANAAGQPGQRNVTGGCFVTIPWGDKICTGFQTGACKSLKGNIVCLTNPILRHVCNKCLSAAHGSNHPTVCTKTPAEPKKGNKSQTHKRKRT